MYLGWLCCNDPLVTPRLIMAVTLEPEWFLKINQEVESPYACSSL